MVYPVTPKETSVCTESSTKFCPNVMLGATEVRIGSESGSSRVGNACSLASGALRKDVGGGAALIHDLRLRPV